MPRYIDAEKALEIAEKKDAYECHIGDFQDFKEVIEDVPSADVEEVRHGEWLKSQFAARCGFYSIKDFICSECKVYVSALESSFPMTYCPHCGAKMDGK